MNRRAFLSLAMFAALAPRDLAPPTALVDLWGEDFFDVDNPLSRGGTYSNLLSNPAPLTLEAIERAMERMRGPLVLQPFRPAPMHPDHVRMLKAWS